MNAVATVSNRRHVDRTSVTIYEIEDPIVPAPSRIRGRQRRPECRAHPTRIVEQGAGDEFERGGGHLLRELLGEGVGGRNRDE
jgi:hypothetical protein